MSLLFNTLSRFVIAFLPRSNDLLISWLQSPSTMILESKKRKSVTASTFFPFYFPWSNGAVCHDLSCFCCCCCCCFLLFNLKPALSFSSFTLIKRLFSSSSLSATRVVASTYLKLLMFLPPILIPACNSPSPAFLMMWSEYRLNKQGDSRLPCGIPFLILNQSVVPYRVLMVASWPTYRFLRKQVRWSGIPISLSSVRFRHSVMSDSLRPHELQQARPPCPSPTPTVHPNPCPLSCS